MGTTSPRENLIWQALQSLILMDKVQSSAQEASQALEQTALLSSCHGL